MKIRLATKSDLKTLVNIYNETLGHKGYIKTYFKTYIAAKGIYVMIDDNNIIIGSVMFEINKILNHVTRERGNKNYIWLVQVMVTGKHQGKGYGTELMQYAIDNVKRPKNFGGIRGMCSMELERYYDRFGFTREMKIKEKGIDRVIMSKKVFKEE